MSERNISQIESQTRASNQTEATKNLQQQALTLFQCKDGSLVTHPRACKQSLAELPSLEITGTQLAGKTVRRSGEGWTTDGGKILV